MFAGNDDRSEPKSRYVLGKKNALDFCRASASYGRVKWRVVRKSRFKRVAFDSKCASIVGIDVAVD